MDHNWCDAEDTAANHANLHFEGLDTEKFPYRNFTQVIHSG